MKYAIFTLILFSFSTFAFAESYLCTQEKVTGFIYQKKTNEWVQANFKEKQLLLKPLKATDKNDEGKYGVYEVNRDALLWRCQYWYPDLGMAHCGDENIYHFKFVRNKNGGSGKFILADMGLAYFFGEKDSFGEKHTKPHIAIGSCIQVD